MAYSMSSNDPIHFNKTFTDGTLRVRGVEPHRVSLSLCTSTLHSAAGAHLLSDRIIRVHVSPVYRIHCRRRRHCIRMATLMCSRPLTDKITLSLRANRWMRIADVPVPTADTHSSCFWNELFPLGRSPLRLPLSLIGVLFCCRFRLHPGNVRHWCFFMLLAAAYYYLRATQNSEQFMNEPYPAWVHSPSPTLRAPLLCKRIVCVVACALHNLVDFYLFKCYLSLLSRALAIHVTTIHGISMPWAAVIVLRGKQRPARNEQIFTKRFTKTPSTISNTLFVSLLLAATFFIILVCIEDERREQWKLHQQIV